MKPKEKERAPVSRGALTRQCDPSNVNNGLDLKLAGWTRHAIALLTLAENDPRGLVMLRNHLRGMEDALR
jgi:hypothetical protein